MEKENQLTDGETHDSRGKSKEAIKYTYSKEESETVQADRRRQNERSGEGAGLQRKGQS